MPLQPSSTSVFNEKELLEKVARGDQRAFETIYHTYAKKIYFFANKILQHEEAAEEVVQEVMLKLWNTRNELTKINSLEAYIRVLSRNIALNALRRLEIENRANQQLRTYWTDQSNQTEEQVALNETRAILSKGIAELPLQQREVYILCHQQGLKYDEVAQKLNLSPATVATHMKLALRFLRAYLQKHSGLAIVFIILKIF